MPTLTLKYRPIQYVDDPFKEEGRNIGVFAYMENCAYFRLIGASGDHLDTSLFSLLSQKAKESAWVLAEWMEWFQALAQAFKGQPEYARNRLEALVDSDSGICVGREAEIDGVDESSPETAVDWLYRRLVTEPALPRKDIQKSLIEHLLGVTEVRFWKGFERDIEVEFTPENAPSVRVQLPYAITKSPRAAFKIVRFQTGGAALIRQINDAVMTFSTIIEHGFAEKDSCILLADGLLAGREGDYKRLAEYGVIIDVTARDAVSQLNAALRKHRL